MAHGAMMLAASVAALRGAAPLRKPLSLRKASAADAIRDALSFAQRASPATADDRLTHSMRARDLTEDELRAVLVGRGVDEAATADVPRGILADLLGELRAADDARGRHGIDLRIRCVSFKHVPLLEAEGPQMRRRGGGGGRRGALADGDRLK